jgi:hypothetical protein
MRYQLVLQWLSDSTETYDAVVEIEDLLINLTPLRKRRRRP